MISISQIAEAINGTVHGNMDTIIKGVCDVKSGKTGHITFIGSAEYEQYFNECKAEAFIVGEYFQLQKNNKILIQVDNPPFRFVEVVALFNSKKSNKNGIHSTAIIADSVQLDKNVNLGPYVVIEDSVQIGNDVSIGAGSFVGQGTIIGDGTDIRANVSIYHDVIIGKNCIVDSGSIIGADGFGLVSHKGVQHKMPHIGKTIIKDNVLIGANCCVDRGTLNDTVVGSGTKFDNFIQIAHNVRIGENCILSGQTAIGGSTILEDNVTLAGQVGIIDHLVIGSGSVVAAKSGVFQSIEPNSFVSGTPAKPHKDRLKQNVALGKLPELLKRVRKLEQENILVKDK